MTIAANEQVLRLQVAVDDVLLVQVIEDEDQVGDIEARDIGREATGTTQVREELAALHKLHEHVQVRLVLEGAEADRRPLQPRSASDLCLFRRDARGTHRLTTKGWLTCARVLRSELTCSIWRRRTTVFFSRTFNAK